MVGRNDLRGHLHYYQDSWGEIDRIIPKYNWDNKININEASFKNGEPTNPEGIICYTDGSKIEDGPTGFGFIIKYKYNKR